MPPRLAQKLMAGRFTRPYALRANAQDFANPALIGRHLREAVLFTADGAAEAMMQRGGEEIDIREDFPNLAPPFRRFWIEAKVSDQRWGVLFHSEEITDDFAAAGLFPGARWVLAASLWFDIAGKAFGPSSALFVTVDGEGRAMEVRVDEQRRPGEHSELNFFQFAFLAVSLLHCKNVRAVEHALSDEVTPKHQRHHRDRGLCYYTLEVDPMREVLRTEGKSETIGLKQALHLCRGHFKDYRQSGWLGKIKGIFWWDAHARGTSEAGVIIKDYNVKGDGTQ